MSAPEMTVSIQNMSITCPAGWRDDSMLVITAEHPEPSGLTPNLVITRQRLTDDLPTDRIARLQEFVDRQIDQMRLSLKNFQEVSQRRVTLDRPTAALTISWTSSDIPVTQMMTYAYADKESVVISTASACQGDFPHMQARFQTILQSFQMK